MLGVAHVVKNRISKNLSEFGGSTYAGVILHGDFDGMNSSLARCPSTGTTAWQDSLSIASNAGTNPIGKNLWFNTNSIYDVRTLPFSGYVGYSFDNGNSYRKVVEKIVIGKHTFFRVDGY